MRQWPILAAVSRRGSLLALLALAVLAGAVEVIVARRFLLDDALIHVRWADLLLQAGFPTADGVTRSFADSSPLFLLLTAAGLALGGSFYVTKILSLAAPVSKLWLAHPELRRLAHALRLVRVVQEGAHLLAECPQVTRLDQPARLRHLAAHAPVEHPPPLAAALRRSQRQT